MSFGSNFSQNKCSNYHEIWYTRHVYIIFYSFFQQNKNKFTTLNTLGHYYKIFHIIKSKVCYYHIIKYFSTSPLIIANNWQMISLLKKSKYEYLFISRILMQAKWYWNSVNGKTLRYMQIMVPRYNWMWNCNLEIGH